MVHISEKIDMSIQLNKPVFSFEYYPPKTGQVRCPIAILPSLLTLVACW